MNIGLAYFIKAHLLAISACLFLNPPIISRPEVKQFLKRVLQRPTWKLRPPPWDLIFVLEKLTLPPFEQAASANLRFCTWKTILVPTFTSFRRASELQALVAVPPFLIFFTRTLCL